MSDPTIQKLQSSKRKATRQRNNWKARAEAAEARLLGTPMPDALSILLARCKAGVILAVNEYRNYYETPEKWLREAEVFQLDQAFPLPEDVVAGILRTGNIVDLRFYPDTPIGSYRVVHYDLHEALRLALECLE